MRGRGVRRRARAPGPLRPPRRCKHEPMQARSSTQYDSAWRPQRATPPGTDPPPMEDADVTGRRAGPRPARSRPITSHPPTYARASAGRGGRNTDGNGGPGGSSVTGTSSMRMLSSIAARGAVSRGMSDALPAWTWWHFGQPGGHSCPGSRSRASSASGSWTTSPACSARSAPRWPSSESWSTAAPTRTRSAKSTTANARDPCDRGRCRRWVRDRARHFIEA